jgi:hypothetical protein
VEGIPFNNYFIFKVFLKFLKAGTIPKLPLPVMTICRDLRIIVKPSEEASASAYKGGWEEENSYGLNGILRL